MRNCFKKSAIVVFVLLLCATIPARMNGATLDEALLASSAPGQHAKNFIAEKGCITEDADQIGNKQTHNSQLSLRAQLWAGTKTTLKNVSKYGACGLAFGLTLAVLRRGVERLIVK